jgi:hypothetical protein
MFVTCPFVPCPLLWGPFRMWYGSELSIFCLYLQFLFYAKVCRCVSGMYIYNVSAQFVFTSFCCDCEVWYFPTRLVCCVGLLTLVLARVPLALYLAPLSARGYSCFPLFSSCLLCSYVFFFVSHKTIWPTKKDTEFTINLFLGLYYSLRIYVLF